MAEKKHKPKKPIYKKWWFWLIVVIIVAGIFGDSDEETATKTEEAKEVVAEQTEKEEEKEKKQAEKEAKEKEEAEKKKQEEQEKKEIEEAKAKAEEEWEEYRLQLLDHYAEFGITDIQAVDGYDVFYAYVPNEFKISTDNEKQYYVEEVGPILVNDLNAHFGEDAWLEFNYEDGNRMATRKIFGGWDVK